jgi:hypothetical protein
VRFVGLALVTLIQIGPASAAVVAGKVVISGTGRPVPGATVILQGSQDSYVTECDGSGRFQVSDLVPGSFEARAEREGYTDLPRGGTAKSKVRPRFTVQASDRIEDLVLKLIPSGTISGRVLDLDGDPLAKISVTAMGYSYASGKKELRSFQSAMTDDQGEFRVSGLAPGRYYLQATKHWTNWALSSMRVLGTPTSSDVQSTYFPGSIEIDGAVALDVSADAHIKDRTITMMSAQPHTLRVTILGASTDSKNLVFGVMSPNGAGMMRNGTYGVTYTYPDSLPGAYFVDAEDRKQGTSAEQWVKVTNGDVDVKLTLVRPASLAGLMWVDDGGKVAFENMSVLLESTGGRRLWANVKADGTFRVSRLETLVYDIHVTGLAGGYVKSIQVGEHESPDWQLDGARPGGALGIAVATDGGRIEGTVVDASGAAVDGAIVVAAPQGKRRAWAELARSATSKPDGKFQVRDLAPGEYRVFAFVDAEEGAPLDLDFRQPYESQGTKAEVQANGRVEIRLECVR